MPRRYLVAKGRLPPMGQVSEAHASDPQILAPARHCASPLPIFFASVFAPHRWEAKVCLFGYTVYCGAIMLHFALGNLCSPTPYTVVQ